MPESFTDHFKTVARHYAENRPSYPSGLFQWFASQCQARDCAWDCGTGSGQAACDLAEQGFARVVATDASAAQIAEAQAHERVEYRVAPAQDSGLETGCADLVVVAQALHWFDLERFYGEVRRVLKPDGMIAVWCYGVMEVKGAGVNHLVRHFYSEVVGPYWPLERKHVERGYRDLPFPFQRISAPSFAMYTEWDLHQLLGYLRSWSATARFIKARGHDPVEDLAQELRPIWGAPEQRRRVAWPLSLHVGRKEDG